MDDLQTTSVGTGTDKKYPTLDESRIIGGVSRLFGTLEKAALLFTFLTVERGIERSQNKETITETLRFYFMEH